MFLSEGSPSQVRTRRPRGTKQDRGRESEHSVRAHLVHKRNIKVAHASDRHGVASELEVDLEVGKLKTEKVVADADRIEVARCSSLFSIVQVLSPDLFLA